MTVISTTLVKKRTWQVFKSQHRPDAHVAFVASRHVDASQHALSQSCDLSYQLNHFPLFTSFHAKKSQTAEKKHHTYNLCNEEFCNILQYGLLTVIQPAVSNNSTFMLEAFYIVVNLDFTYIVYLFLCFLNIFVQCIYLLNKRILYRIK